MTRLGEKNKPKGLLGTIGGALKPLIAPAAGLIGTALGGPGVGAMATAGANFLTSLFG